MKKNSSMIIRFVLLLALVLTISSAVMVSGAPATNTPEKEDDSRTISVGGEGKIYAKPDIAYISIGVQTEALDARTAQRENATKMDKVTKALKEIGVADADIQTNQYSINPKYQYHEKPYRQEVIGYTVNNSVKVTIRDITKVGDIIDRCVENGANVSNYIQFSISDQNKFYNEALKMAVKNAKSKAESIASVYNIKLGQPSAISENSRGGYLYDRMDTVSSLEYKADNGASTPISAGEMEISASVSLTYKY